MTLHPDWRYGVLTAGLLTAIYGLSSIPDLGAADSEPLVLLVSNLSHVPLFALLAFCWLKTVSGGHEPTGLGYAVAAIGTGACAAFDEWHQSFVPGRHLSANDLLLDLAGMSGMLIVLHVMAVRGSASRRPDPSILSG